MSVENVKTFIERFNNDETFRNQISRAAAGQEWLTIARQAGFDFTEAEFQRIIQTAAGQRGDELSEAQLEIVAGGMSSLDGKGNDVLTEEITFLRRGGQNLIGMLEGGK